MITFRGKPVHSIEKIFDLIVEYKGLSMPVAVYLIEEKACEYFYHCVCFEGSRNDRFIAIDKRDSGEWCDMMDRDDELAKVIGNKMDALEQRVA